MVREPLYDLKIPSWALKLLLMIIGVVDFRYSTRSCRVPLTEKKVIFWVNLHSFWPIQAACVVGVVGVALCDLGTPS